MRAGPHAWALLVCGLLCGYTAHAATLYVDPHKDGAGTDKAQPSGKLCTIIDQAKDGDVIQLVEGTYTLAQSCVISRRRISILGGFRADFSTRDPFMSIARITGPGTLLRADAGADDLLVEGVMFDGGPGPGYSAALCNDCLAAGYDPAKQQPLVVLDQAGRARFRSVVFANAPGGALSATMRSALALEGVSMVNARPFGVRVAGSCGYAAPRCVDLLVRGSSFVWAWRDNNGESSLGGSAIIVGAGVSARIEKTVIAYSDRAAVELETEEQTELGLQQVVTFDNRAGDVMIGGVGKPVAEVSPTSRMERLALPWDIDYLNRYLARAKERFYGNKLPPNRVFMLSPTAEGLKTPSGSRLSYESAVAGTVQAVQQVVAPPPPPPPEDDKKKKAKKTKKGKR